MEIKEISFEEILDVWVKKLWPGRIAIIEPVSAINQNGLIDCKILSFEAFFFGTYLRNELVGVISTHLTEENVYRLRGIYVDEKYRGLKIGTQLIEHVLQFARNKLAKSLWALARHKNKNFYETAGFQIHQNIHTYEFGPHYIMTKSLIRLSN